MRDDQYQKLQALSEELTDVVIRDVAPANWIASSKVATEMSQQERGDAYWSRKLASASLSVLMRVTNLIGVIERRSAGQPPPDPDGDGDGDLDKEISAAEREAANILKFPRRKRG